MLCVCVCVGTQFFTSVKVMARIAYNIMVFCNGAATGRWPRGEDGNRINHKVYFAQHLYPPLHTHTHKHTYAKCYIYLWEKKNDKKMSLRDLYNIYNTMSLGARYFYCWRDTGGGVVSKQIIFVYECIIAHPPTTNPTKRRCSIL